MTFQCSVYRDSTHSAIVVSRNESHVTYIPLSTLAVTKTKVKEFDEFWNAYPEYPVRRAAEVYLRAGDYRPIPPQTKEHLERIVANPATAYEVFDQPKPTEGIKTMAKSPKSTPARNGISSVAETAGHKGKPAAKAASHKTPAEALKTAVKGKAPFGHAAPKGPEPKSKPAAKAAAPAKQSEGAKPARNRIAEDVKYKVVDTSRVKRGFLAEFVEKATLLKVFTREKLEAEFATRGGDTRTYFPYAVGKGIFAPA